MNITTKVTLASLLIFPGIGHFILKKYLIGFSFVLSFLYLLYGFITQLIEKSQEVVDSIIRGEIPLEVTAISEAISHQSLANSNSQVIAGYLLVFIWGLAAFDAYRLAKKSTPI